MSVWDRQDLQPSLSETRSAGRQLPPLLHFALHKGERVAGKLLFTLEHPSPDLGGGGEFRQRQAKGFDHHPSIVTHFLEGVEIFGPANVAGAGVLRSFSEMCTCTKTSAQPRIASAMLFSSMFA